MVELIITEKPSAAKKIAEALAEKKIKKCIYNKKVPYYEIEHAGNKIVVVCAVGHLYNLVEKNKKGWIYPVFDIEWKPAYEIGKGSQYTRNYLNAIKKLAKDAKKFSVATDYDIEGEVIGYNLVRFACNQKDARRMKFSTTTKEDLLKSYKNISKKIDWPQVEAGLTRHILDWWWGINFSRALTLSIKNATKSFKLMSIGRVQGPTLKILTKREKEILAFVPIPFWQIEMISKGLNAWHEKDKFWEKKEAAKIVKKLGNKKGIVDNVNEKQHKQMPPYPFDLTALQIEAYKQFNISPKNTLSCAQELYTNSYISYPRTSSNQLPPSLDYKKIIKNISKQKEYKLLCDMLLKKKGLAPNNGKKTDMAHPAIYPTGEKPKKLKIDDQKIYDLIVRRTLASFGDYALRETVTLSINIGGEIFISKGTRTLEKGWYNLYGKYVSYEEKELPLLKKGDSFKIKKIELHEKETQHPKRYTPASIIKELEKRNLGTKATRTHIVDNLFDRNYLTGKFIEVTNLGIKTVETLDAYCPEILDDELTKVFEEDMDEIRSHKNTQDKILKNAKKFLKKALKKFKENEIHIGKILNIANAETLEKENFVGKCNLCGGKLKILYSRRFKSRFIGCSNYPKCKNTFSLPFGLPKVTEKTCPECGFPLVKIIRKGKRPFDYCINKKCPKKLEWLKKQEEKIKKAT
ncbi:MAG: DNA topoisomerase I [Nanoarchaeota archaeon]|nr:DNA topoisomerase I [Nanoarchaeota archaeon]